MRALPLPRLRRRPQARAAASAAFASYWQEVVASWPQPLGSQAEIVLASLYDRALVEEALASLAPEEAAFTAQLLAEWRKLPPEQLQETMGGLQSLCLLARQPPAVQLPEVLEFLSTQEASSRVRFLQFTNLYLLRGEALREVMASWEAYRELPLKWIGEVTGSSSISSLRLSSVPPGTANQSPLAWAARRWPTSPR